MSLMKDIYNEMVTAMKNKDKLRKDIYSSIYSAMKNKSKSLKIDELADAQAQEVIQKLVKQNQESISTCPADRKEIMDNLQLEKEILGSYMPKMMDENEIARVIEETLSELRIDKPSIGDKGKIMKSLMPKVKGHADGKMVNGVVGKYLK